MKTLYLALIIIFILSPAAESQEPDSMGIMRLKVDSDSAKAISGSATLNLLSDPDGAKIVIEMSQDTVVAPETLNTATGDHSFKAMADGYEALVHTMTVEPDKIISLNFILAFTQPPGLTAEDLGLEYMPTMPLKEEAEAAKQKEKFDNLAETFALIPLGQGILARILLGDETDTGANILIATGASLTATAYILGKIFPKRKLAKIRAYNEEASRINSEAKYHNQEVESKIEAENSELLENWMLRNQNRGKVEITVE